MMQRQQNGAINYDVEQGLFNRLGHEVDLMNVRRFASSRSGLPALSLEVTMAE